ncbi:hypothetical protein Btru_048310 [Bulinus truncatus]|nr:hypothetical protein Btru_048310 [Bulinus truncatus]
MKNSQKQQRILRVGNTNDGTATNIMALPIVLFSSSTELLRPQDFVRSILKAPDLPEPKVVCEQVLSYEWHFETKYYDTTIQLCTTENNAIGDDFAGLVEAFIHFFDPNSLSSFAGLQTWLLCIKQIEPEVQMLVCTTNKNTDVTSRQVVQEWCIQHGFELVELQPENDSDEEENFPETTGMARIIQALHAHIWPNMNMKTSQRAHSQFMPAHSLNDVMNKGSSLHEHSVCENVNITQAACSCDPNNSKLSNKDGASDKLDDALCINSKSHDHEQTLVASNEINNTKPDLVNDDEKQEEIDWKNLLLSEESSLLGEVEEFEQLFTKLKVMKDKADTMSEEEKKKYAEKVAVSFWRAIGGDEDEIEGLDEESD